MNSPLPSKNPNLAWSILKSRQNMRKVKLLDPNTDTTEGNIRFVVLSDTHGRHKRISIPDGDVLLHCGDFTLYGDRLEDVRPFDDFLGTLPHTKKVLIAGNHDFEQYLTSNRKPYKFKNCVYLQDSSATVFGYKIYGSPWIPTFHHGAFNLDRGEPLTEKWKLIPSDTDIVMTHGPPVGYGDKSVSNGHAGDVDLLIEIQTRIKPLMHLFGHIHEGRGCWSDGTTTFVNASVCNVSYQPVHSPFVFELPRISD